MNIPLLTLLSLAASSGADVERVHKLAASSSWDEVLFATEAPARYSDQDRAALAAVVMRGCQLLISKDAALAEMLGQRSTSLRPTPEAVLCTARAAAVTQPDAIEGILRKGVAQFPANGALRLALGKALLSQDPGAAADALAGVPKSAREYTEAQALLRKARTDVARSASEWKQGKAQLAAQERGGAASGYVPAGSTSAYQSSGGADGMRLRANNRFQLRYFNSSRDFGQRAEYEGRVIAALDEAYEATRRVLGQARETPCHVILYTKDEFAMHFPTMADRVAGFYMDSAIRMNNAAEMSPQSKGTLVHEYVHAAVDDWTSGQSVQLPRWVNEGLAEHVRWQYEASSDGPPYALRVALRGAAIGNTLPSLQAMDRGAPINQRNAAVAYSFAGMAVSVMMKKGGASNLLGLIREVGAGSPFDQVLQRRYDRTVPQLQEELREELSKR